MNRRRPATRLHKGAEHRIETASGFNPSRGPGRGLHREPHHTDCAPARQSAAAALQLEGVDSAGVGEDFSGVHDAERVERVFDFAHDGEGVGAEV